MAAVAAEAALSACPSATSQEAAAAAMRWDFEVLRATASLENWTDETSVNPEFLGPLWPHGEPPDWAEAEELTGDDEIVLQIDVPEGATDKQVIDCVRALVGKADELHRAHGGHGLRVSGLDAFEEAPIAEGVVK